MDLPRAAPGTQCLVGAARPRAGPRSLLAAEMSRAQTCGCHSLQVASPCTAPSPRSPALEAPARAREAQPEPLLCLLLSGLQWDVVAAGDPADRSPHLILSCLTRVWNVLAGDGPLRAPCPLPHWQPCLSPLGSLKRSLRLGRAHGPPACSVSAPPETVSPVLTAPPSSCRSAGRSAPSPRWSLFPGTSSLQKAREARPGGEGDSPGRQTAVICPWLPATPWPRPGSNPSPTPLRPPAATS